MAERQKNQGRGMAPRHGAAGFTLVEMLAALAILLIGVTTLLATLGGSVGLRRSTDARLVAAQAVEDLVLRVQQTGFRQTTGTDNDRDLELAVPPAFDVPGFPGLRCTVTAQVGGTRPTSPSPQDAVRENVWLLRVQASWLEGGEAMTEEFLRVVPRQLPLGARVQRFREENGSPQR